MATKVPHNGAVGAKSGFADFIDKSFVAWQNREGRGTRTLREYAEYLGFEYDLIKKWSAGTRAPGPKHIPDLVRLLGSGVYEALGIDPDREWLIEHWDEIPPEGRQDIIDRVRRLIEGGVDIEDGSEAEVSAGGT